jgi:hypothetical protein
VEGGAASHYVEVPVVIRAETDAGEKQRFEGKYTLRRAVVAPRLKQMPSRERTNPEHTGA